MTTTVRNIRDGTYDPTDPNHVYIGRANRRYRLPESKWSNPYPMDSESERQLVIDLYRHYIVGRTLPEREVAELKGKTLYCWCKPKACHGDVLAELAGDE